MTTSKSVSAALSRQFIGVRRRVLRPAVPTGSGAEQKNERDDTSGLRDDHSSPRFRRRATFRASEIRFLSLR